MIVKNPDKYIKFIKYSLIPIGYIMNGIGKVIRKQHIELLGHYLTCSGKSYNLDSKVLHKAIEQGDYSYKEVYSEIDPISDIKYAFVVKIRNNKSIKNILGKFILLLNENGEAIILDEYKFYPCVDGERFEISNQNLSWYTVNIFEKDINIILSKKFSKMFRICLGESDIKANPFVLQNIEITKNILPKELFKLVFYINSNHIYVNIAFLDKIFYFLGKQFNVKTNKFKLSERRYNYLIKEWNKLFEHQSYYWNHQLEEEY